MFYRRAFEEAVREHKRERAAWEAERSSLLDRIMLLAGTPWALPPAEPPEVSEEIRDFSLAPDDLYD